MIEARVIRHTDYDEDLDTFNAQQALFQPTQLRYARNMLDLMTDEAATLRELMSKSRRDNLKLLAQLDEARSATYRARAEYQQWHVYQNACRTAGTEKGNRLLPLLPEMVADRIHQGLVEEVARLKVELANTRSRLQLAEADADVLRAELRYRQGRG